MYDDVPYYADDGRPRSSLERSFAAAIPDPRPTYVPPREPTQLEKDLRQRHLAAGREQEAREQHELDGWLGQALDKIEDSFEPTARDHTRGALPMRDRVERALTAMDRGVDIDTAIDHAINRIHPSDHKAALATLFRAVMAAHHIDRTQDSSRLARLLGSTW